MRKETAIIAILVAGVAGFFVGSATSRRSGPASGEEADLGAEGATGAVGATGRGDGAGRPDLFKVPVGTSPSKGERDALVTIVEFSEFQCPFCSKVVPTIDRILQEYRGKVRFVFKHNPLPMHQNAMPASEAAMAANAQGKFWEMYEKLWANQRALTREDLERYAQEIGLDMARFKRSLDTHEFQRVIQADQALAQQLGARGTPNFFINGRPLRGAQPFEAFKTVIDEEIQRAERLVKSGTPRSRLYAELTKDGQTRAAGPEAAPGARGGDAAKRPPRPREDPNAVYKVTVDRTDATRGPDTALVTIVEWTDFQCPFCSKVQNSLRQVEEHYGNKVRMVVRMNPLPFHDNAMPAAEAAMAAHAQGKFFQMHDKLFENQQSLTRETFERLGQEIGLDMARFRRDLDNHTYRDQITAQQQAGAALGARGTPSFFINGKKLRGAQPFEGFKAAIDAAMEAAETAMRENHLRPNQVYDFLVRNGATAPVLLPGAAPEAAGGGGEDPNRVYQIADAPRAPFHGGRNARVVIQQFSDFQCPFCGRVEPTLAQLLEQYGDRIKVVWRNFPLPMHSNAMIAAEASLAAHAQGKFWQMHEKLFANQRALERADLERYAEEIGLDMARFRRALDEHTYKADVEADMEASRAAGARHGTPAFFINGRLLQGAQPIDAFKAAIDAALATGPTAPARPTR